MSELHALIEVLGEDLAVKLMESCSGTRVFVPQKMPTEHLLLEFLGEAGMALMIQYYGGDALAVPEGRAWRIDFYKRKMGLTVREMARRLHCSEKTVYAHLRGNAVSKQFSMVFE